MEDQTSIELHFKREWSDAALLAERYRLGISLRAHGMGWGGTAYPDYTYRSLAATNRVLTERGLI